MSMGSCAWALALRAFFWEWSVRDKAPVFQELLEALGDLLRAGVSLGASYILWCLLRVCDLVGMLHVLSMSSRMSSRLSFVRHRQIVNAHGANSGNKGQEQGQGLGDTCRHAGTRT